MILGKYMHCLRFTSLIIHAKTGMMSDREKVNNVPISIWFLIKLTTNFQSESFILFIRDADKIRFTVTIHFKHNACPGAGLKHA